MDLIRRTKEAVKEFDNIRYRRMKKVFLDQEEQASLNTSHSSVPNASLVESNELILMDIDNSKNLSFPNVDDDDSRSTDFISDSQPIYPDDDGDDASLNSSHSSLQQASSLPMNSLLIARQFSNPTTSNLHPRFSSMETTNPSCFQPLQINIHDSNESARNDVNLFVLNSISSTIVPLHFSPSRRMNLLNPFHRYH